MQGSAADRRTVNYLTAYMRSGLINAHNSNLKVLIAADSADDRETLFDILGLCFELESAASGAEALAVLENGQGGFGLMLLASSLPSDGGPDVLELFKKVKEKADIPVLLAVSAEDGEIIDIACAEGITDFILRPFVPAIVRRRVENALLLHSRQMQSCEMADIISKEKEKDKLFSTLFREIEFEYSGETRTLKLSEYGANYLNMPRSISKPQKNPAVRSAISKEELDRIVESFEKTTPDNPIVNIQCRIKTGGQLRWYRLVAQASWKNSGTGALRSIVGKTIDINDFLEKQQELEDLATRDTLTGLFNRESARKQIISRMNSAPGAKFALVMLDIDYFKEANDTFGHSFGDETLIHLAKKLTSSIRTGDIAARIGGDEFLIFMQYKAELEPVIKRIYNSLVGRLEQFELSISMGVAESEKVGENYEQLLECADKALYSVKRSGKKNYRFYDDSMVDAFSARTPIDNNRI